MATLEDIRARYPAAETFTFGDSAELSETCLALVRSGAKTATCGALRDFETGAEALPEPGRHDIALDWEGAPALVIRTVLVEKKPFDAVDEDFAMAEGEFADFAEWREGHVRFFTRNGGWSPDMMLVCERFEMVEDLV